jgi:hypothetical protein
MKLLDILFLHGTLLFDSLDEFEDKIRLFGIKAIDFADVTEMFVRFALNIVVLFIIVRLIYYPITKRKDYLFTFFMFGTVVFFICLLMASVKLEMGFALGLFALFSLLRYRTDPIPIKEMTYLFIVIGVSVINSLSTKKVSFVESLLTNAVIIFVLWGLERRWIKKHEASKRILYEKIELVKAQNKELLIKDLRERTGLPIHRFEIERINFLRDTARIYVFYYENRKSFDSVAENDIIETDSDN